jgi:D-alanyl-D-alanine carboxypeptidase
MRKASEFMGRTRATARQSWLSGLFLAALLLAVVGGCGGGGDAQEEENPAPRALDAAFKKSFEESRAPGAMAAVQTPEYTWVRTLGVADTASKQPMKADLHTRIASVTKTFTGTLLLQAEAEDLLSLDDTIDEYVKGVPNGDEITLRQMAKMTSGIASYDEDKRFLQEQASEPQRVWKPEELAAVGIKDSPQFDPGADFHYSNTNTVLLGLVLEKVTGKPLGQLYQERIIEPLDLRGTSFPDLRDSSLPDPHTRGYTLQADSGAKLIDATDFSPSWGWAAGGMISTVEDLLVYGRALGTGKGLLAPEQQAERLDSLSKSDVPKRPYGIGLDSAGEWLGHNGEMPGFTTTLFYHPELDATVVVTANSDAFAGDCPPDAPTLKDGPGGLPCQDPASRMNTALVKALGEPFPPLP